MSHSEERVLVPCAESAAGYLAFVRLTPELCASLRTAEAVSLKFDAGLQTVTIFVDGKSYSAPSAPNESRRVEAYVSAHATPRELRQVGRIEARYLVKASLGTKERADMAERTKKAKDLANERHTVALDTAPRKKPRRVAAVAPRPVPARPPAASPVPLLARAQAAGATAAAPTAAAASARGTSASTAGDAAATAAAFAKPVSFPSLKQFPEAAPPPPPAKALKTTAPPPSPKEFAPPPQTRASYLLVRPSRLNDSSPSPLARCVAEVCEDLAEVEPTSLGACSHPTRGQNAAGDDATPFDTIWIGFESAAAAEAARSRVAQAAARVSHAWELTCEARATEHVEAFGICVFRAAARRPGVARPARARGTGTFAAAAATLDANVGQVVDLLGLETSLRPPPPRAATDAPSAAAMFEAHREAEAALERCGLALELAADDGAAEPAGFCAAAAARGLVRALRGALRRDMEQLRGEIIEARLVSGAPASSGPNLVFEYTLDARLDPCSYDDDQGPASRRPAEEMT
ncbi:hypothetical protein M885DRAFT_521498 [Pelagophyceae sp. CCMP2097]|nr:hypothetical protein M885DRAFT_521498 [Pelagophyceae sp. CCMP2097]